MDAGTRYAGIMGRVIISRNGVDHPTAHQQHLGVIHARV